MLTTTIFLVFLFATELSGSFHIVELIKMEVHENDLCQDRFSLITTTDKGDNEKVKS